MVPKLVVIYWVLMAKSVSMPEQRLVTNQSISLLSSKSNVQVPLQCILGKP